MIINYNLSPINTRKVLKFRDGNVNNTNENLSPEPSFQSGMWASAPATTGLIKGDS
jgi:hypothetical protein